MAVTILKATVIRWKTNAANPPTNEFDSTTDVTLKVGDATNNPDRSPILAQYILGAAAGDPKAMPSGDPQIYKDLLTAARDGLLQVVNVSPLTVAVPPIPVKQ